VFNIFVSLNDNVYLFFIYATLYTSAGRHDALFVVGSLDETVMLRGMRYHPIDIETSVLRSHRKICEWYVFDWQNV